MTTPNQLLATSRKLVLRAESSKGRPLNRALARGGALTALTMLIAIGCGEADISVPSSGDPGAPRARGDVGTQDAGENGPEAPPPPTGKPTSGIFVSSSKGIEGADGTKDRPVKTLAAAIALAETNKTLPVLACAETYSESLTLIDGVTMYGFFDCQADWEPVSRHAQIVSPTSPALLGEKLTQHARFEGFDVIAPDIAGSAVAGTPAVSSYGAILRNSKNLRIANVSIVAGKGQDGSDGVEPAQNVERSTSTNGRWTEPQHLCTGDQNLCIALAPFTVNGGLGGSSDCKEGPSGGPGGQGGSGPVSVNGALKYALNDEMKSGKPYGQGTPSTAQGASPYGNLAATRGVDGSPGAAGSVGANGEWTFDLSGFVPGDGKAGLGGNPGQGGGGGPGTGAMWYAYDRQMASYPQGVLWGAAGAGGGAGGCAGIAGSAGTGGGASVGLLLIGSDSITIVTSRLEGKQGGRGGNGTLGTVGLRGGNGGPGQYTGAGPQEPRTSSGLYGGAGGNGGAGGPAGLSGHGAPGPSFAFVFTGTRPNLSGTTLVTGRGGNGSAALTRGQQTIASTVGVAKEEHSF